MAVAWPSDLVDASGNGKRCLYFTTVPGGANDVPVDAQDVVEAANFAITAEQAAMKADGKTEKLTLVKIVAAKKQVVAGMNYILTLDIKLDDKPATAEATVWSRPWLNKTELTGWKIEAGK